MSQFDWPIAKKLKLWRFSKIEESTERSSSSPFGQVIKVRSGGLLGKSYGIKGAIGSTLGKHIRNLTGTHWELEGNMLGTKEN
jgi:hypothetical protein